MNLNVAVPEEVNCAKAKRWLSTHCDADASQNSTCPGLTGVVPDATVAVKVTTAPASIEVTDAPPLLTVSVVTVAVAARARALFKARFAMAKATTRQA